MTMEEIKNKAARVKANRASMKAISDFKDSLAPRIFSWMLDIINDLSASGVFCETYFFTVDNFKLGYGQDELVNVFDHEDKEVASVLASEYRNELLEAVELFVNDLDVGGYTALCNCYAETGRPTLEIMIS